ncbi:MAG: DsbA family protein [Gammaproteobacteria bacterium WSBS_2016_MAG_OTU1]
MILWHVHDPMCAWCWGFRPTWQKVVNGLPHTVRVERVVGGLAADSDVPMPDEMRDAIQSIWRRIQDELETPFNFDFWKKQTPRRSTYLACRAVVAAKEIAPDKEEAMITAIQESYYQRAENPSDMQTLVAAARRIGLITDDDMGKVFADTISSPHIEQIFQRNLQTTRALGVRGFPSLVLELPNKKIPITLHYQNPKAILNKIHAHCNSVVTANSQNS